MPSPESKDLIKKLLDDGYDPDGIKRLAEEMQEGKEDEPETDEPEGEEEEDEEDELEEGKKEHAKNPMGRKGLLMIVNGHMKRKDKKDKKDY